MIVFLKNGLYVRGLERLEWSVMGGILNGIHHHHEIFGVMKDGNTVMYPTHNQFFTLISRNSAYILS